MSPVFTSAVEIWKDIPEFEGKYQVSNFGNVRSLDRKILYKDGRTRRYTGKILKPIANSDGYLNIQLCDGCDVLKTIKVHRLVAEAFVPNPDGYLEINHIDEDKTNNNALNLEWCDRIYNCRHGTRNDRISKAHGKPVILSNDKEKHEFESCVAAANWLGVRPQSIDWAKRHGTKCRGYFCR